MGTFGGYNPFPRRFGGAKRRVRTALEGLNQARGDAYSVDPKTTVYAINFALARLIARAWDTTKRIGLVWQPMRTTMDIVARWENILALAPDPKDTDLVRRQRVAEVLSRFGMATTEARVTSVLQAALGAAFVAVEFISVETAFVTVPDNTYPFGTVLDGAPWSSTVAHVLVRLQQPTGWSDADFYAAAGKVTQLLDPIMPAWSVFDWYRPGSLTIAVTGGPSAAGFKLDDAHNLDEQVFDV